MRSSPSSSVLLGLGLRRGDAGAARRNVDVAIPGLGHGLDGLRVAVITDTHYGPIDRARWSAAVVERVNELDADVVCHVGDIADGTVEVREPQARPLASVRATLARVYVTGNHEYFSEAQGWLDYMESIGWEALHNRHIVVERGGDRLVIAGVDDATAKASGVAGTARISRPRSRIPIPTRRCCCSRISPSRSRRRCAAGVDLQISGHTHGGQIWPFNFLVRLDQPVVHGLSQARRADPALHQPRHRILGPAVPGVRAQRDHAADPPSPSSSAPPQRG